jgi:hypothetical protein
VARPGRLVSQVGLGWGSNPWMFVPVGHKTGTHAFNRRGHPERGPSGLGFTQTQSPCLAAFPTLKPSNNPLQLYRLNSTHPTQ